MAFGLPKHKLICTHVAVCKEVDHDAHTTPDGS